MFRIEALRMPIIFIKKTLIKVYEKIMQNTCDIK
jgi:hypothetical protein